MECYVKIEVFFDEYRLNQFCDDKYNDDIGDEDEKEEDVNCNDVI